MLLLCKLGPTFGGTFCFSKTAFSQFLFSERPPDLRGCENSLDLVDLTSGLRLAAEN
jgi:hypothetical protein